MHPSWGNLVYHLGTTKVNSVSHRCIRKNETIYIFFSITWYCKISMNYLVYFRVHSTWHSIVLFTVVHRYAPIHSISHLFHVAPRHVLSHFAAKHYLLSSILFCSTLPYSFWYNDSWKMIAACLINLCFGRWETKERKKRKKGLKEKSYEINCSLFSYLRSWFDGLEVTCNFHIKVSDGYLVCAWSGGFIYFAV